MAGWKGRIARFVLALSFLLSAQLPAVSADQRPLLLQHLSTLEGLPQGTVNATLQDSQGFVWLGTEDGLVRYDGYEIHRYSYSAGVKDGLPGNFVFAVAEDKHTDLWLALKGSGIARWNRATDTFTVYRHDESNDQSLSSDMVRTLLIDSKGRIWIGTLDAGVDVLDPATGRIRHLRHRSSGTTSLFNDGVYALTEDRRGEMWIGTNIGIDRWLLDGDHFKHSGYVKTEQSLLSGKQILSIIDGSDGTLWVGTFDAGLFHLDYSGQTIEAFRHAGSQPNSLSSDEVHSLLDDHAGHLWIGTSAGLDALERGSNRIVRYTHDKSDPGSLTDSFIMSLYEDGAGLLWIGTRGGGVNRWNSHSWELGGSDPNWLDGKLVTSFADAAHHHLWIGTLGGGLFNMDLDTGAAANLDAILHTENALGVGRVMSLYQDRHNTLWIGTWGAGLKKLTSDGKLSTIPVLAGDARSLSADGVAVIFEAKNGLLWIGTHGGGANVLDPATGSIRQIPFSPTTAGATSSENVTSFTEDSVGNIWIGTEGGGLDVANPDGAVLQVFNHDPANPQSLSSNIVYALATDSMGGVWIATDGGGIDLVMGSSAQSHAVHFESFSQREGLSSDTIYSVLPDSAGHLWLSGNSGLMRFDLRSHIVKTFHREHGLQGEEFNSGAYYRTLDGRLCFAGPGGINVFNPARLSTDASPPRIALIGLEVLGAPVRESSPYWLLRSVPIDYRASVVSFDFAALDFKSPARNRLAYRVTGVTDQWIDLNAQRRVTLTNLDAGDHVLEVRAANADSDWSTVPYRLTIHKSAAPWRTAKAYVVYATVLFGLIVWAVHNQRRKLQHALAAKRALEQEVAVRTSELRETNHQLIVASEAKSEFLSRMGHELRTPMNGVVGMTELLARAALAPIHARQVQTIRSSARILLNILNDLLDLSKAQAGKIELECLPIDLTQLLEECVAMFAGAAESKSLDLIVCPALEDEYEIQGDPLRLRQILMNLIGNAIKFTERGEIVVTGDIALDHSGHRTVLISVADTGIGMSTAAVGRVFEPFTQADETTTRRFGGTGLGLSICRQLVVLMGGEIAVDSRPQNGSTFTVSLPLAVTKKQSPPQSLPALKGTMVVATRRRALAEAFRRHATILRCNSRVDETVIGTALSDDDILIIDADSYPTEVEHWTNGSRLRRVLVVASSGAIASQGLEKTIAESRLLRSPVQGELLRTAIDAVDGVDEALVSSVGDAFHLPRRSAHVLIVEDDAVNAAVAEGYISTLGGTSTWAKDGVSAVARHVIETFDLILMDLNMPGLDGYQTAKHIRERETGGRRVPIIALTANEASVYRERCIAAGMDDILTKPYTVDECAELLRRWVDQTGAPLQARSVPRERGSLAAVDAPGLANWRAIGGSRESNLYVKLVALFEKSSAIALGQIAAALAAQDLEMVRANAHKLKGAAGNVGALAFAARVGELEHSAAANQLARANELYGSLASAYPALMEELHNLTLRESA